MRGCEQKNDADRCPNSEAREASDKVEFGRLFCRAFLVLASACACSAHRVDAVECVSTCGGAVANGGSDGAGAGVSGSSVSGAAAGSAGRAGLPTSVIHRYDFEGGGTTVFDRVGGAHGIVIETELSESEGRGAVTLAGRRSGQYVELPSGMISSLHNATFEAWITWNGVRVWERVFDFGDQFAAEAGQRTGATYLFLTPRTPSALQGLIRLAHQRLGQPELVLDADVAHPTAVRTHLAVVVDNDRHVVQLFRDGELVGAQALVGSDDKSFHAFETLNDQSNWLGRSLYDQDAFFGGIFHEFRIHDAALSAADIFESFRLGPDPE